MQVALQVALPELDGAIEPIIFAGRDGVTGRSIPQAGRLHLTSPSTRTHLTLNPHPHLTLDPHPHLTLAPTLTSPVP